MARGQEQRIVAPALVLDTEPRRLAGLHQRAAWVEAATGRNARGVGRLAREVSAAPCASSRGRPREGPRVRVLRSREELLRRARPPRSGPGTSQRRGRPRSMRAPGSWVTTNTVIPASFTRRQHERARDLAAHRGVEGRHRLVSHEQVRVQRHGAGDDHALALATGDLVRVAREEGLGGRSPALRAPRPRSAPRLP